MTQDKQHSQDPEPISQELEQLANALIGYALDLLCDTGELAPTLAIEDISRNNALLSFEHEEMEEAMMGIQNVIEEAVSGDKPIDGLKGKPYRYAIAYDGAIAEDPKRGFEPALIVEYGEHGMNNAWSAYILYQNAGIPEKFGCTDPAPAGECDLLV